MQLIDYGVTSNERIAKDVYRMELSIANEQLSMPHRPGQFVNLLVEGFYLRRPISVCDCEGGSLTLIYKVVGQGTARLAEYRAGETINVLTGLGNGYTLVPAKRPLLLGGGVGVPPLYYLAKELVKAEQAPIAVLGFNTADEVFFEDEFAALCQTIVMTADGTRGRRGFVTHAMEGLDYDAIYTCGPEPMLEAIYREVKSLPPGHAQFSFEQRMACGFGGCMGCSCKTVTGYKRICKEGPVLAREEILW